MMSRKQIKNEVNSDMISESSQSRHEDRVHTHKKFGNKLSNLLYDVITYSNPLNLNISTHKYKLQSFLGMDNT